MRTPIIILLLTSALILVVGCEGPRASRLQTEWPQIVERARIQVLDQLPNLDTASRDMIRTNAPTVEFVGLPFGGDYTFVWSISSNRMATLNAFSTPEDVEGRPVRIRERVHSSY